MSTQILSKAVQIFWDKKCFCFNYFLLVKYYIKNVNLLFKYDFEN